MSATPTLGLYVRVSRKGDREDDRFHSPKEQAERASALAVAKGFVPGPIFEDIDVSGGTAPEKRPAMGRLLEEIEAGRLAGIAAYSLDRLSREPAHGDTLVRRVTKAGGVLLTPDMPDAIDSPTGEFTFGMLLQVARLYRSQSRARFASAKERAIRAGIPVSTVPVGYRQRDPHGKPPDRTLEPDPQTAPVVRHLFERRAAGAGWTELAGLLSDATGRTWTLPGVRGVLTNRMYATGRLEHGGIVSDVDSGVLVDEPLWHAGQANAGPRPKRNGESPWLLTGLARCAACDYALAVWTGAKRRRNHAGEWVPVKTRARRYRCRNRKCAAQTNVNANLLEPWVVLHTFNVVESVATRGQVADLGALEDDMAAAERRLEQVMAEGAADDLGELWAPEVRRRREARDEAAAALGTARAKAGVPAADLDLIKTWHALGPADRRATLASIWKAVHVGRKGPGGTPTRFVARGGLHADIGVALLSTDEREGPHEA